MPVNVHEVSRVIFAVEDAEKLPEMIVGVARRAIEADYVSLMLHDERGNLFVAYSDGLPPAAAARSQRASGVAARVAAAREPVILNGDVSSDPRFQGVTTHAMRSSIVYPLVSGDQLLGVLSVNRTNCPEAFGAEDLERVGMLAAQVVMALRNAKLVRRLVGAERLAAIGQVAAGVAHEINNPAAYVLANISHVLRRVSALEGHVAPAELDDLRAALTDAYEGATRIRDIVKDMRSLAKTGGERSTFDLNDAVRSALRIASAEIRGGAEIVTDLGEGAVVEGGPGSISQVFVNLLVNAAHALAGRPGERTVRVTTRCQDGRVVATVEDNGCGIPPEHLSRVFEPFFSTKPEGRGTGLGLAICRDVVRRHGGDITVRSTPGVGTTMTVVLPVAGQAGEIAAPPQDLAVAQESPALPERALAAPPARGRRVPRILVVDDEAAIRSSYARAFHGDCEVVLAANVGEAEKVLDRSHDFELIICDLIMPGQTGVELYQRLRASDPALAGRFVLATGMADPDDEGLDGLEARILQKPFELEDVRALLRESTARLAA